MTAFQHYEYKFDLLNDSVMTRTMAGKICSWNRSAEKLYGWRKEEVVGRISHDLLQTQFPKPLKEIESELMQKGRWEGKLVHATRRGDRVLVESRWTLDVDGEPGAVVEVNAPSSQLQIDAESARELRHKSQTKKAHYILAKIAEAILGGGALLCILLLVYCIYDYGWAVQKRFTTAVEMVVYCFLPAVLGTLLIALLRWKPEFKLDAAVLCVSLAAAAYGGEVILSALTPSQSVTFWGASPAARDEIVTLTKKSGVNFDFRTKFEVVRDLRQAGISAVPAIAPLELLLQQSDGSFKSRLHVDGAEVVPLGGISNRVTVMCNETGTYSIYDSDSRGFHNPKTIWQSNSIAIAAVGDSFTAGACVPSDRNFVALIRGHYPETLNLGMLGHGPLSMLAATKEYLPTVKPKTVLWFFYEENDFRDLLKEAKAAVLTNYLQHDFDQGLFERQAVVDQALTGYVEEAFKAQGAKQNNNSDTFNVWLTLKDFLKLSHLRQRFGLINEKSRPEFQRGEKGEYTDAQLDLFRTTLAEAKKSVEAWGGTLYFVYLPARDRYANKQNYDREAVLACVKNLNLPVIDIHDVFIRHADPLSFFPFGRFGHYNEAGNRVVADEVLGFIRGAKRLDTAAARS